MKISGWTWMKLILSAAVLFGVLIMWPGLLGFSPELEDFMWTMRDNLIPNGITVQDAGNAFEATGTFAGNAKPSIQKIGDFLLTKELWVVIAAIALFLNRGGMVGWFKGLIRGGVTGATTASNWGPFTLILGVILLGIIIWTYGWEILLGNSQGAIFIIAVLGILFAVKDRIAKNVADLSGDLLEKGMHFILWTVGIALGGGFLIGPEGLLSIAYQIPVLAPFATQAVNLGARAGFTVDSTPQGAMVRTVVSVIVIGLVLMMIIKKPKQQQEKKDGGQKGGEKK